MLAIEKPFPIVPASLGGIASLAVGFAGTVAILSAIMPKDTAQNPNTTNSRPATVAATNPANTPEAQSSPQQFTSSYATPDDMWNESAQQKANAAIAAKKSSAASQASGPASTPASTPAASSPVTAVTTEPQPTGGMGATPVPTSPAPVVTVPPVTTILEPVIPPILTPITDPILNAPIIQNVTEPLLNPLLP